MTANPQPNGTKELDFPALWGRAAPWAAYLRPGMEHAELWKGIFERVLIPGWALDAFTRTRARRFLVIAADWCGDAANTIPVAARLAELIRGAELRVLERDQFPEVMNRYLTNGSRSIPIVVLLDESFGELGHWGPRPAPLQSWVLASRKTIPSPQRYAYARKWYAKDKGETMLREMLEQLASG